MQVLFYKNKSEPIRMDKSLEQTATYNCALKDNCSVVDPVLLIDKNGVIEGNYFYIPDFKRYYFITDIVSENKRTWRVSGHCDVLSSFKSGIRNCEAVFDRNQYKYNLNVPDEKMQISSETFSSNVKIGNNAFNQRYLIIQTLG